MISHDSDAVRLTELTCFYFGRVVDNMLLYAKCREAAAEEL
jgi:hypothetical protein